MSMILYIHKEQQIKQINKKDAYTMKNLKFMVQQANKGLEEVIQYIESVEECFQAMDLKLHSLNWTMFTDKHFEKYDSDYLGNMFNLFCEDNYNWFCEWEKEEGIDNSIRKYVGRTSTFYLDSKDIFNKGKFCLYDTLISMIEYNLGSSHTDWIECITNDYATTQIDYIELQSYLKQCNKYWLEDEINYTKESLEYISSGELLKDIKTALEDGIKEYNYIKEFKENSVEYFKEFLEINEDEEE